MIMSRIGWLSGVALLLLGSLAAQGQTREERALADPSHPWGPIDGVIAVGESSPADEYYLGIECLPVMPALQAQLNLPERQGVLVGVVVPGSPARAVGIAQHDVLIRVGDKSIAEPRDLFDAVQASKGGKLKIALIRGGKPKTVEISPAKRSENAGGTVSQMASPADWEAVRKWMEGAMPGQNGNATRLPGTITIVGPGTIVSKGAFAQRPMPADMAVAVSKAGDHPAKISVRRGDEKWELTEKELDKLPADVRPYVEQMLGRGPFGLVGNIRAFASPTASGRNVFDQPLPGSGQLEGRIEKRLDEMNQRIDKLFQIMEQMAEGQTRHNASQKGAQK